MKKKYDFCLTLALILMIFLMAMSGARRKQEDLASRIAPEILRFHVLANSDSPEDQTLKLEVKEYLLELIRKETTSSFDKQEMVRYIEQNRTALAQSAEQYMSEQGFDYHADVRLEVCEFPEKTYGDMTFPAGEYEAVRVVLGKGKGKNFWCVLYPSLCYLDSSYAIVPDTSKELLQTLLPEDDFQSLLRSRRFSLCSDKKSEQDLLLPRLKIRFKLAELFD